jgi:hypothetical protein
MKETHVLASLASLCLAATLAVTGCSKGNNPQQQSAQTPAQAQPASPNTAQPTPPADSGATTAAPDTQARNSPPPPPAVPASVVIPAGTSLRVRLDQDLGSKISQPGDSFEATVANDVEVGGRTVIPRGARAEGVVADAKPLGRFKGGAMLALRLERVETRWGNYPVSTSTMSQVEKGKGKRTAEFAGGGGALGAIIGGLAGGGKGALIGGLAGAGAGTAGTAMTGNKQILLPAETLVTFRLEHSVHVSPK